MPRSPAHGLLAAAGLSLAFCAGVVAPMKGDNPAVAAPVATEPLEFAPAPPGAPLFTRIDPAGSGLTASNPYDDPEMWARRFAEFSGGPVGTGLAVGDYDRDGRPDLFVVNKTAPNRLYRQTAPFVFEDVTEKAGVAGSAAWGTGATFADYDGDGWPDLFVCQLAAPNLLYHNNGDGTFTERAAAAGLARAAGSVCGAFADYDRDGDLDLFLVTNLGDTSRAPDGDPDVLYRNNGDGTFTDVTAAANIVRAADRGHSATWFDADGDGWIDLHVANDFDAPDHLYRNNRDGTFTDIAARALPHLPWYAMGADCGDIDNDGRLDLFVADMAGTTHLARQTFSLGQSRAAVDAEPGAIGQYALNALYLNVGGGRFLEIARLAGVDRTDWTWSVLFGDFDNDGWQDLHVTNGMLRDFANADLIARMRRADSPAQAALIARRSPVLAQENLAFRNTGALRFEETSAAWGLQDDGVSFGAVAADLDGDGDLDLVYTNLDRPVSLFRNDSDAARVSIVLRGRGANPFAVGARVIGTTSAGSSARQVTLARGTLSSAPAEVHFGLGRDTALARLEIHWPDGRVQVAENLPENRRYVFQQPPAPFGPAAPPGPPAGLFHDITAGTDLVGVRLGRRSEAGKLQPLLPLQRPAVGPGIAAGDADGDGDPDIYFAGSPGTLYLNEGDGRFIPDPRPQSWNAETAGTETTPLWFDADGDGDLDLLVLRVDDTIAAGAPTSAARLYLNDGAGVFQVAPADRFPAIDGNASVAAAADFDGDGDLDLFIGGATKAGRYPLPAGSRLLENRRGVFVPSPLPIARGLSELGRVTGALWADVNGDHWPDLVVVAEWAPLRLFLNQAGRGLVDATDRTGCAAIEGWWRALTPADVDGDGDIDLIAGNIGLNTSYQATVTEPVRLYFGDFDESGASQILEAYFERGRLLPRRNYATLVRMFPTLRRQFQGAADFGRASLDEIFVLDDALKLEATQLAHGVFLNDGTGRFEFRELPRLAQAAPVNAIAARDFDGDGCVDLLLVQNDASPPPEVPRFDGGRGLFLHGHGDGTFTPLRPEESGIDLPEPVRSLVLADLNGDAQDEVLLASEDGRLRVLAVRETKLQ